MAAAIETRKDQIEKFDWAIVSRDPDSPRADAQRRIDALTEFWRHPDGETEFATWLRTALHDLLTIDAPAFEIRRTRGGDVIGLDVVDGATIKLLVDDTGRRPRPPAPAYEQVIHGRPWRLLTSDELLYAPRNRRSDHAYGFGPVEQVMMYINIGLRRAITQLNYYTSGNVPEGLICAPEGWNAEQIRSFQEWFEFDPRRQPRRAQQGHLDPGRRQVPGLQIEPDRARFRGVAGAGHLLRLQPAADGTRQPSEPRHRRDDAAGGDWPRATSP